MWRRRIRSRRQGGKISLKVPPYKRRKFVSLVILGTFLGSTASTAWVVDARLRPSLRALALAKARVAATIAVNQAVLEGAARSIRYQDLMTIQADQQGRPVLLQPNTGEINRLAASITLDVQRSLLGLKRTRIRLPVGQVLGSQILGAWGPEIPVDIMPVGTVEGHIVDSFSVAGINQTRHRICVRIRAEVKVVVPLVSAVALIKMDVPLAEAVIMGEVPQIYLDGRATRR